MNEKNENVFEEGQPQNPKNLENAETNARAKTKIFQPPYLLL